MIKLGDRIPAKRGRYPAGRYCVLEFDVGRREPVTIRESFQLIDGRVAE